MARLIYSQIVSLDGYIEDEHGKFDWSMPTEEVHAFVNDRERPVGTYLYGRRLYEVMKYWATDDDRSPIADDYARIWQAADKVVYSRTLEEPSTERTRLERDLDPDAIRALKETAVADIGIGGPDLAADALRAGLVDEVGLYVNPIVVGGGKPVFPDGVRVDLELLEEHRFSNGVVFLRYDVRGYGNR